MLLDGLELSMVSNSPCGVESSKNNIPLLLSFAFLIHRVELKELKQAKS